MADASASDRFAYQTAEYYAEPPEVLGRNITGGVYLAAAALVSFFGAFLFAFFYLKEINHHSVWRPPKVQVPTGSGVAILACIVASAIVTWLAYGVLRRRGEAGWRVPAIVAHLLALAALVIQCIQWARLGFGPGSGAYASVFIGWTGFYAAVALLPILYWSQTMISASYRHRNQPVEGAVVATAGEGGGQGGFRVRLGQEARSFTFFWWFLAGVEVVTFVLLYIVA